MYWLFLLLAIGAFFFAVSTTQMWLLVLALLAALVFSLLWIRGLYVAKFGDSAPTAPRVLHPAELQRMRDQLLADRPATATPVAPPEPQKEP